VTNGAIYYYQATAINANGESSGSNEAKVMPQAGIPQAPANLFALPGDRAVGLTWTAAPGATSYTVYRAAFSGGLSTKTKIKSWLKTPGCNDSSVEKGTTYYYQVTAANEQGESSGSNEAVPQAVLPAAPSKLSATTGGNAVGLIWTAVPGATSYNVYRANASGALSDKSKIRSGLPGRGYKDSTATPGIIYYYQVTAVYAQGESGASNEANAMPSWACTDGRDCPSGVCASGSCQASTRHSGNPD
jgi:cellulose 1,4-beta-cellobiosidase